MPTIDPSVWSAGVPLITGWLLGLLSPLLAELIQRPLKRRQLRKSILVQLKHLRYECAGMAFLTKSQSGEMNRPFIEWAVGIFDKDKGAHDTTDLANVARRFLNFTEEDIAQLAKHGSEARLQMRRLSIDFLASQVPNVHLFNPEFQRIYHEILGRIATINALADLLRTYELKTFDAMTPENRAALLANHQIASRHIGIFSEQCAKLINDIEDA